MRFRDHRQILLKGVDVPDLPSLGESSTAAQLATPRYISPDRSGRLAAQMAGKRAPLTMPSRASIRSMVKVKRSRVRGVALRPEQMPWKKP